MLARKRRNLDDADVHHGLAVASSIGRLHVHRLMDDIGTFGSRIRLTEFRRLDRHLGEVWSEEQAQRSFAEAAGGCPSIDGRQLHTWIVRHAKLVDGELQRHQPITDVLMAISPEQQSLFSTLDVAGTDHRLDNIAPGRAVDLASHLVSVYTILRQWRASDEVCTAGLFHSVYETAGSRHRACNVLTERPFMQAALGERVERLVYLFQPANKCAVDTPARNGLWDAPLGESFVLPGVLSGQPKRCVCPPELRAPLITLYWANDIDQEPDWLDPERSIDYAIDVLMTSLNVLPLFAGGAAEWVESLRRRVATRRGGAVPFESLAWTRRHFRQLREEPQSSHRARLRARIEAYRVKYEALLCHMGADGACGI